MKVITFVILSLLLFNSCKIVGNGNINIIGRYYLENDEGEKYVLGYKVNSDGDFLILVDFCVYSAGIEGNYIIVKQHPKSGDKISATIYYYIVPLYENFTYSPKRGIIGPLTEEKFNLKCAELHIPGKNFNLGSK